MIRLECVQGQHSFNLISGDLMMPFTGSFNMASGVLWSENGLFKLKESWQNQGSSGYHIPVSVLSQHWEGDSLVFKTLV